MFGSLSSSLWVNVCESSEVSVATLIELASTLTVCATSPTRSATSTRAVPPAFTITCNSTAF